MLLQEDTLSVAIAVTGVASATVLGGLSLYAPRIRGPIYWAASFACIAFGFGTYFLSLSDWRVNSLLWNIPTSAGPALLFAGLERFCGGRLHNRFVVGLIGAGFIATLALTYVWPNTTIRIGALAAVSICGYVGAARIVARDPDRQARSVSRLLALTLLVDAASLGARALVIALSSGIYQFRSPALEGLNSVAWIVYLSTAVITAPTLVLLVAVRLRAHLDEERRRAMASERKSRALFDAAAYGSYLTTNPGDVLMEVNEAWLKLFGYSRAEVIGKTCAELGLGSAADAKYAIARRPYAGGLEAELTGKDGHAILCLVKVVHLSIDGMNYDLVMVQDITLQRQLERVLLQAATVQQQNIGHDLHEGLSQELAGISMLSKAVASTERLAGRPAAEQLDDLAELTRQAAASCRAMSHGLLPLAFTGGKLVELLEEMVVLQRESYGLDIRFEVIEAAPMQLKPDMLESMYRLAQEAVAHARRHSAASAITVTLDVQAESVRLEICDDGVAAMDPLTSDSSIGHRIMRARAHLVGAELLIAPRIGGGTLVSLECPQPGWHSSRQ
jgi:PAS domain S-box-containing protein